MFLILFYKFKYVSDLNSFLFLVTIVLTNKIIATQYVPKRMELISPVFSLGKFILALFFVWFVIFFFTIIAALLVTFYEAKITSYRREEGSFSTLKKRVKVVSMSPTFSNILYVLST